MTTEVKITDASVVDKVSKGEELTPEEQEFLKGNPDLTAEPAPAAKEENPDDIKIEKEPGKAATSEPAKKAEEEKPVDVAPKGDAQPESKQTPEERKAILEAEFAKPEASRDLSKFNENEIGLYWEQYKQRKKLQKLEEENEILRIKEIQRQLNAEAKPKEASPAEEDPLAGKDDEDILTVADVRKIITGLKPKPAEEKPKEAPLVTIDQIRIQKVEANDRLRTRGVQDFYDVIDYAETALGNDPDAQEILRDTAKAGGNVVEKTYWLIKGSKAWAGIQAQLQADKAKVDGGKPPVAKTPPQENVERAKKIEENAGKVRTTGPATGAAEAGEYTVEEIQSMTIDEIKRLPKATRQAILKKFGSAPNMNR